MTYAESQNKPPFDWNAELQKKIDGEEGIDNAKLWKLARNWPTCACGRQCEAIPRNGTGMPIDPDLRHLGYKFEDFIFRHNWLAAQATLAKIEARSAEILATL